ncbi:TIGR01777 family oxidoreductase [Arenibacter sp. F20364]|uniref:TIGR01777 family oxidoreductase n=1 Tax=Arenibacter sp. F20364 TaxID=2926415 RepID=UPI001FF68A33|nr:TIGR01777 family oxidoreductase [Arenibacter sp. F20364]MCK0190198.1 TIGR01777 family oxidoreductase [Arenibacter sp. F20364]
MKVLVTGATGLVGSEIVDLCKQNNIPVNYLTTRRDKIVSQKDYNGFYWNPNKNEIDLKCFNGVTTIINLAGSSISKRWTRNNKKKILNSRVNSLRTLLGAIPKDGANSIKTLVSASAIGIYPNSLSQYYKEDEEKVDDSFLGEVVSVWEQEVDAFEKLNIQTAKIRIGLVMSNKGGALPEMAKPVKYYMGAAMGSGNQWQSWIHLRDLGRVFLHVISKDLTGIYNAVAPNPVTNVKLTKEIARVLGKPLFLPNIPKIVMRLVLGEMSYLLFASQRVSSKKIEDSGFYFIYPNICRALENIYLDKGGHKPIDALYKNEFIS